MDEGFAHVTVVLKILFWPARCLHQGIIQSSVNSSRRCTRIRQIIYPEIIGHPTWLRIPFHSIRLWRSLTDRKELTTAPVPQHLKYVQNSGAMFCFSNPVASDMLVGRLFASSDARERLNSWKRPWAVKDTAVTAEQPRRPARIKSRLKPGQHDEKFSFGPPSRTVGNLEPLTSSFRSGQRSK
jgi:hypothetical protein